MVKGMSDFWNWVRSFLCSCSEEEQEIDRLELELLNATEELKKRDEHLLFLSDQLTEEKANVATLEECILGLNDEITGLNGDIVTHLLRISTLEKALADAIVAPDISHLVGEPRGTVEPFLHPELGRVEDRKMVYDLEVADDVYYTFPKDRWIQIMELVKEEVRRILLPFSIPTRDCDNFSEMTSAIAHKSFIDAGIDMHGAVCIMRREGVHAFNGFIDDEDRVWVWDSTIRDASLIGELGTTSGNYVVTDVIFSG